MSDLSALHKTARSLIFSLRDGVEQLEKAQQTGGFSAGLSKQLHTKLADLQRISQDMERLWRMQATREASAAQGVWKRKVEQVGEEADHLRLVLERHSHRERRRQVEEAEREQLLARTGEGGAWRMDVDAEAQAMGYVANSRRALEEAFATGTAVLASLAGQRETLKAAQRKALDVLNSVGLSDSVLRLIDRRQRLDKWLTYGGMVVIVLLVGAILWWSSARRKRPH